jgi:tRNA modification GTPase
MVLWMPGPASFTGEDVVELHLHGGQAVATGVLGALGEFGLRPADPGEFSRRAFERGKLDLTEAEAIADLIDADSAAQRRQALNQLAGATSAAVAGWRQALIDALAALEAAIDFPDEEVPTDVSARARAPLTALHDELTAAAADLRGEKVRHGYRIALIGAPNAGKSSILNGLVGRSAAIVTEVAGTTRDVIEQPIELDGYRAVLADTAGLRETDDRIEAEGVLRARGWAEDADLRLWVVDTSARDDSWRSGADAVRQGDLLVLNKADLRPGPCLADIGAAADSLELEPIDASATESGGLVALRQALERRIVRDLGGGQPIAATRLRHRLLLNAAARHVERALADSGAGPELMAEDVRLAARSLEALTGRVDTEVVLDAIFSEFCIGK